MRVMVIGSGAREHALAWRLAQDHDVSELFIAPGNGGTERCGANVAVDVADPKALVQAARSRSVDFAVVGPEAPLVAGLVDAFEEAGVAAFGPSRVAARLEGSKAFAKAFMARHAIPTGAFSVFEDADAADAYIREADRPLVVKADGLAAGKGVVVADGPEQALEAVDAMMRRDAFGSAGQRVVIEERLEGQEVSYHAISDGERYVALAPAQDHKRIFDGDRGPNTGGMGAYSPPPVVDASVESRILHEVVEPTIQGMAQEGHPFRGALFVGLMVENGVPRVLEYNVRFGDPECQTMLARWQGPLLPLLWGAARGDLAQVTPAWDAPCAMTVVLAARGYPASPEKGQAISGLAAAEAVPGVAVFHAGTRRTDAALVTAGGRVLGVSAVGPTVDDAAQRAYQAADLIQFSGKQVRRDIGWRARSKA